MEYIPLLILLVLTVVVIAGMWKAFDKAGQPGWACIVPIYNVIVMLQIAGKPVWWVLLIMFVPIANIVCFVIACIAIAENFGKGGGFGVGLAFLGFIFWPILGFGDAQFRGVKGAM